MQVDPKILKAVVIGLVTFMLTRDFRLILILGLTSYGVDFLL